MLAPHPRTTYYIDPDRTSREPGQGNVTPSRPRAPTLNMCCSVCTIAADGSQRHLLEDHILDQHIWLVKSGWGGICWLDESFVERAHQEGVKEDRRTQGVKGYEAQQTAQFKAEERASNPKVEERRERNSRVARTRKRTRTEAVKAETDDKRQQMIMMATDGDEDVEMGAGHV